MTEGRPWWQTAVIYQVYPRSFLDTDGDGIGDLVGVTRKLDYLCDTLGVDAVWLSPFYPSPQKDFGYDVSDYCDVDPQFGDLAGFDRLLAAAHARGLRIIVDLVPNHTSDQHPWFLESRSSPHSHRRDWYVWQDPKPGGEPPNNWLSVFGGSAWEWDEPTGQYYLHSFLKEQPDLNWRNPDLRKAFFDVMRFWLDRGVDGFRIDVAHYLMKDPLLRDNPPTPPGWRRRFKPLDQYDRQLHVHDKGHADVHGVFREMRALLDSYDGDRFAVGEIHVFDWDQWAANYGAHLDELHMPFNFALIWAPWQAGRFRRIVDAVEAAVPPGGWPSYVLGNHDEPRVATRLGRAQSRTAAMLLLTLRGTPTLYYGDELGMEDVVVPPDQGQDPWATQADVYNRDGCRSPMQWSDADHAGFSPPEAARPWLPVGDDYRTANVASQLAEAGSHLNLYRRLLAYRRNSSSLRLGSHQSQDSVPDGCFVYTRRALGAPPVTVLLNFTADPLNVAFSGAGRVVLSTHLDREEQIGGAVELRPHEGIMVEGDEISPSRLR